MRWSILLVVAACGGSDPLGPDGGGGDDAAPDGAGEPTAAQLLARIASCDDVVGGPYATSNGEPDNVSICGFPNAVVWKADLSVDCDGKESPQCNLDTDPYYLPDTAAHDSNDEPLDAATLPYVVVPGVSSRWSFRDSGLAMGTVVAVIYEDRVEYGPLGDIGPTAIIGEASYAMAAALGIDPDPSTGGIESGVAYIAFTGAEAALVTIEDHAEAVAVGIARAKQLLAP